MEKLKMHSLDFAGQNIARLAELFPSCVTESEVENGILKKVIDFDLLRQELADHVVEGARERYHVNWPGKREALLLGNAPIAKTLRPCRAESVNFSLTRNLFIEGDNLEVLKLLQETYLNKAKLIYLDPPYNTGNDQIYRDEFSASTSDYLIASQQVSEAAEKLIANPDSNGRFHSDWLSMQYPRLRLARNLLRDDGIVAISIDNHEVHNLIHLVSDVFGHSNILGVVANVNNPKGRSDDRFIATAHEYIVFVARDAQAARTFGFKPEEKITKRYRKTDESGRLYREIDLRKTGDADKRSDRPDMFYYFYYDTTSCQLRVSKTQDSVSSDEMEIIPLREDGTEGRWRWGFQTASANLRKLIARRMPNRGIWGIFEKDFLEGRPPVKPTSAWTYKDVNSERGTEDFMVHGFQKEVFPRPKPLGTMRRIIEFATLPGEESVVIDLYSGSGTLAEASFEMSNGADRIIRYVGVQLAEVLLVERKDHAAAIERCDNIGVPRTVAEITKERIRRAGKHIIKESETDTESVDVGFRVLKIDTSNMKDVYYSPDGVKQADLLDQIDNIKEDRTPEDLLFQVLLDWGVDLSLPITEEAIEGKNVFFVDENALAACFDKDINEELVKTIAARKPLRAVFRDSGYGTDSVKINVEQIFKLISPSTEVKSI